MISAMRNRVIALAAVVALGAGCGPVAYINQVTRDASSKVDRARELEAEKYSPYWWTRAITYLRMAREVEAHADHQGATRFGRLSSEAAEKAAAEAESPNKRVFNPTETAPAKEDEDVEDAAPKKKSKGEIAPAKE